MGPEGAPPTAAGEIEARLVGFIQDELLSPGVAVDPQDDLLSGELLDSVAMLRLATFVEEKLEVPMRPADFVIDNFRSVVVLTEFVLRAGRRTD